MRIEGVEDVEHILRAVGPRHARNLARATVHDMAKAIRDDAKEGMPENEGTMKKATKHKRERARGSRFSSTVRVGRKAFYWRFLEYGLGPDGVAYDFFLRALQKMRGDMHQQFFVSFGKKFEATLARARK